MTKDMNKQLKEKPKRAHQHVMPHSRSTVMRETRSRMTTRSDCGRVTRQEGGHPVTFIDSRCWGHVAPAAIGHTHTQGPATFLLGQLTEVGDLLLCMKMARVEGLGKGMGNIKMSE